MIFLTEIRAVDPTDGKLKTWAGPEVEAPSFSLAEDYCRDRLGYCRVVGQLVMTIPCKPGTNDPDYDHAIDHEAPQLN
jgi:hypothetical protein